MTILDVIGRARDAQDRFAHRPGAQLSLVSLGAVDALSAEAPSGVRSGAGASAAPSEPEVMDALTDGASGAGDHQDRHRHVHRAAGRVEAARPVTLRRPLTRSGL